MELYTRSEASRIHLHYGFTPKASRNPDAWITECCWIGFDLGLSAGSRTLGPTLPGWSIFRISYYFKLLRNVDCGGKVGGPPVARTDRYCCPDVFIYGFLRSIALLELAWPDPGSFIGACRVYTSRAPNQ